MGFHYSSKTIWGDTPSEILQTSFKEIEKAFVDEQGRDLTFNDLYMGVLFGVQSFFRERWTKDIEQLRKLFREKSAELEACEKELEIRTESANESMQEVERLKAEKVNRIDENVTDLRKIAFLIGSIYFHGHFVAETVNEEELERLLRKHGFLCETEEEMIEVSKMFR